MLLGRVRGALRPAPVVPEVPRGYRRGGTGDVDLFCARVEDYVAVVRRVSSVAEVVVAGRVVVAPGLAEHFEPAMTDGPAVAPVELEAFDTAVTGCAVAIAETGTIALDGGPLSGRRALTLVPDHHVCVVREDQVVPGVPEAIAALEPVAREGRPITFVSGPSATSDIELERVEGVHGPRKLDVYVVG